MNELIKIQSIDEIKEQLINLPINPKRKYIHPSMQSKWSEIDSAGIFEHRGCEMAIRYGNVEKVNQAIKVKKYSQLKSNRGTKPYDIDLYIDEELALDMTKLLLNVFIELADYGDDKKPSTQQIEFIADSLIVEKDMYFEDISLMLRLGISGKFGTIYQVIRVDTVCGEWLDKYRIWRQAEYKKSKELQERKELDIIMNKKGIQCPDHYKMDMSKIGRIPRQRGERKEEIKANRYETIQMYFNENEGAQMRLDNEIDINYDTTDKSLTIDQFRQYGYNRFLNNLNK